MDIAKLGLKNPQANKYLVYEIITQTIQNVKVDSMPF